MGITFVKRNRMTVKLLLLLVLLPLDDMASGCSRSSSEAPLPDTQLQISIQPDPLSAHVLDTTIGLPADGIQMTLEKYNNSSKLWELVSKKTANAEGRASDFFSVPENFVVGTYKMRFETDRYFQQKGVEDYFYPYADVVFQIKDPLVHYHIPLLLNPFGYTTYRGS